MPKLHTAFSASASVTCNSNDYKEINIFLFTDYFIDSFFKIYFIDFLQRGRERDRELETSMREKHRPVASCTPPTRDVPTTNVHALDWNRTWDLSVCRPSLYPLSQITGQGRLQLFISISDTLTGQIQWAPKPHWSKSCPIRLSAVQQLFHCRHSCSS